MFEVLLERCAQNDILSLPKDYLSRITSALTRLEKEAYPHGCRKIVGSKMIGVFESEIIELFMK